jgi:glutamyl/glutaminyl-tRNA synthetase
MALDQVVTRFAPSPTGHLHVGGARTALFCWAFAKRYGGRFMIRIEDTDQARSSEESARGILDDLAWLGLAWDDGPRFVKPSTEVVGGSSRAVGPYFQAQRVGIYNQYIEAMVRAGHAYPAFETNEELDAMRKAATAKKETFKYRRPSDVKAGVFAESRWQRAIGGEAHVIRVCVPSEGFVVKDLVLGDVKFSAGELDDFVIRKQDGFPTYHFAVVVDDELMGVTHVLRAQEHLINTPKHMALQRLMRRIDDGRAFSTPAYAHMPLIFNPEGSKMSKRDKAKAARKGLKDALAKQAGLSVEIVAKETGLIAAELQGFHDAENDSLEIAAALAKRFKISLPEIEVWDYRVNGYLPEALVNFLALLGWSPGVKTADGKDLERFDQAWLGANFAVERIGKTNAKFDRTKLLSFNSEYVAKLSDEEFSARVLTWADAHDQEIARKIRGVDRAKWNGIVPMVKSRCKTLSDVGSVAGFALVGDEAMTVDAVSLEKAKAGKGILEEFVDWIGSVSSESLGGAVDAWIKSTAEARKLKLGEVAQPIRVGLTGSTVSPPLGDVAGALGVASCVKRIGRVLTMMG